MTPEQKERLEQLVYAQNLPECLPVDYIQQIDFVTFLITYTNQRTQVIKVSRAGKLSMTNLKVVCYNPIEHPYGMR